MRLMQHQARKIGGTVVIALVISCLVTLPAGCSGGTTSGGTTLSQPPTAAEAEAAQLTESEDALLALINIERVDNGLPELVRDQGLDEIMLWYGTDMVLDAHIGHEDANGRLAQGRVVHYGERSDIRCSEITAWWSNGSAEDHYNAYFNSPDHEL